MQSEKPFSDPDGPKFKIVNAVPRDTPPLTDEEARRWLAQPVTRQATDRTIDSEEVPDGV